MLLQVAKLFELAVGDSSAAGGGIAGEREASVAWTAQAAAVRERLSAFSRDADLSRGVRSSREQQERALAETLAEIERHE